MPMQLLDDRYAPVTHAAGFLEADFQTVNAADERWRRSIGDYPRQPLSGNLPTLFESLLPLTGPLLRYIWVRTTASWTAYFDNFVHGSDPHGPVSYLAQQIRCRGVMIQYRPQTSKAEGGISIIIFGPEKTEFLNHVRSISAINDGRWQWDTWGAVQPFEETQHYTKRRIRDRLTPEMLERYCAAMGIRPFDESFYANEGCLVENRNVKCQVRSLALEQAQEMLGLDGK
jgi:hypothetical protein